ncbi:MAG: hypothetical protein Q9205_006625 [Flavoplaca limonia]
MAPSSFLDLACETRMQIYKELLPTPIPIKLFEDVKEDIISLMQTCKQVHSEVHDCLNLPECYQAFKICIDPPDSSRNLAEYEQYLAQIHTLNARKCTYIHHLVIEDMLEISRYVPPVQGLLVSFGRNFMNLSRVQDALRQVDTTNESSRVLQRERSLPPGVIVDGPLGSGRTRTLSAGIWTALRETASLEDKANADVQDYVVGVLGREDVDSPFRDSCTLPIARTSSSSPTLSLEIEYPDSGENFEHIEVLEGAEWKVSSKGLAREERSRAKGGTALK